MELLSFSAPWCHACHAFAPVVASLSLPTKEINVENHPEVAEKYGISGLPTLIAVKDGKPSRPLVGAFSREKVLAWLRTI